MSSSMWVDRSISKLKQTALRCLFLVTMMGMLTSCSSLYFVYQAGKGQLRLLNRGRPIEEVANDPTTNAKLAALLKKMPEIKKFGEKFGLKPTKNYSEYVKLDQDSVVYVVTISDPLEFKAKVFSFPIAGSFTYIGWFDHQDAVDFASKFEKEGYDVDVRGASAFSTLGWFRDPLLSSMMGELPDLVNVVIHESVHATVYIKDQSFFNESLAYFVADELTQKYFSEQGLLESPVWLDYETRKKRYEVIQQRMARAFQDLKKIYESTGTEVEKREKKSAYLAALQSELKLSRKINNATLIQFKTYDPSDHGFGALLKRVKGDEREFLRALSVLKSSDFAKSQQENFDSVLDRVRP